jgi:hypothetical protein
MCACWLAVVSISRTLLNGVPRWLLALAFAIGVVALSLLLLLVIRRRWDHLRAKSDSDAVIISAIAAMALTIFALMSAFAIVSLYSVHEAVSDDVVHEASDLAQVSRDSAFFPGHKAAIHLAVKNYVLEVYCVEFKEMRNGRIDPSASKLLTDIFMELDAYKPATGTEVAFYQSAVDQLNDAVAQRRSRIGEIDAALPSAITLLLILTAMVSIALTCFIATTNRKLEVVLVASVAIVVSAAMLTTLVLEFPFSGSVPVSRAPYEQGFLVSTSSSAEPITSQICAAQRARVS